MKKEKIKLICKHCKKDFYLLECQVTRGRGKFCSKACSHADKRKGDELTCFLCGKKFYRAKSEQDVGLKINQFCSKPCYFKYRVDNLKETTYKKQGSIHEHRIIAEAVLGRKLTKNEVVHHIDLNKHNNNIDNLAILPNQNMHAEIHFGNISNSEIEKFCLKSFIK